jgi:GH24 family phage-related lysozyme (muramidase)
MALKGFLGRLRGLFGKDKVYEGDKAPMAAPREEASPAGNPISGYQSKTQEFEGGHRQRAYLDSLGKPTIGTGTLLENKSYSEMPEQYRNMELSEEEGNRRFQEDYGTKMSEVEKLYGDKWGDLPDDVKGVMTDMAYNVGSEGLFNKFSGFIKDVRKGNYANAAKNLKYKDRSKGDIEGNISNWWDQVGGVTTESNIASGEWGENSRTGNRATSNYDMLSNLGNKVSNQPIDRIMDNVVTEQGSRAFTNY